MPLGKQQSIHSVAHAPIAQLSACLGCAVALVWGVRSSSVGQLLVLWSWCCCMRCINVGRFAKGFRHLLSCLLEGPGSGCPGFDQLQGVHHSDLSAHAPVAWRGSDCSLE